MKTTRKLLLAGAAATMLLMAGCADGPTYSGPTYDSPYYSYYGPYYNDGGVVVLDRGFYGGRRYGHGLTRVGGHGGHGGGYHRH